MVTKSPPPPAVDQTPSPPAAPNPSSRSPKMVISPTEVELTLAPGFHYKMIQCINHFIDHLVKYHENDDDDIRTKPNYHTLRLNKTRH